MGYTKEVEEKVNKKREGKSYLSEEDSKIVRANNAKKRNLPVIQHFNFFDLGPTMMAIGIPAITNSNLKMLSDVLPIVFLITTLYSSSINPQDIPK